MLELGLESDIKRLIEQFNAGAFSSETLTNVTVMALNRSIDGALTETDRAIRAQFNIKREDVRKVLGRPTYASRWNLHASFTAKGHRIPVYFFDPKPSEPGRSRKPVSVSISKGGGRKSKSSWFIARMKSGHIGVFERTAPGSRSPIHEIFTISVAEMLNARKVNELVTANTRERFLKEFERLLKVMLKGGFS